MSYGPWQLATNRRQPQAFLASPEGRRWAHRFVGKAPGTKDFGDTWKSIARSEGTAFFDAQRTYIGRSHYEEALNWVKKVRQTDLSQGGSTIQDVVWSRAVQLGPKSPAFRNAIDLTNNQVRNRGTYEWERAFISNIYLESGRRDAKGRMVYFTKSPSLWDSLSRRFRREAAKALEMLRVEWEQ